MSFVHLTIHRNQVKSICEVTNVAARMNKCAATEKDTVLRLLGAQTFGISNDGAIERNERSGRGYRW
jgi:hypothetical protein